MILFSLLSFMQSLLFSFYFTVLASSSQQPSISITFYNQSSRYLVCPQFCLSCQTETNCSICQYGFLLNQQNSYCQIQNSCSQPNCISCNFNQCQLCSSGFVLSKQSLVCVKCSYECIQCSTIGQCITCNNGYFLNSEKKCQPCVISFCVACINSTYCTRCDKGYGLFTDTLLCLPCPINCQYCVNPTSCLVCDSGYFLTSVQKCKPCSTSCENCFGISTNCSNCNIDSYYSQQTCTSCSNQIPFCISCFQNKICINCTMGMYSTGNSCLICQQSCLTCFNNSQYCTSCKTGFFLKNSLCLPCNIEACTSCANSSVCIYCAEYYYLNKTTQSCSSCIPKCQICSNSTNCQGCEFGLSFMQGICAKCVPNCVQCSKVPWDCAICNIGYFLETTNLGDRCIPCPIFCLDCSKLTECNKCSPGTFLVNASFCIKCLDTNCYNCNNTGYCLQCKNGYYLNTSNQNCESCMNNCRGCINNITCFQCDISYYLQNQTCFSCPKNCAKCDNHGCFQCNPAFYNFDKGKICISCPKGCKQCVSNSYCLSCIPGFYISPGLSLSYSNCLKCQQTCLQCNSQSICTLCIATYRLDNTGICINCPQGCLDCNNFEGCMHCLEGYYLSFIENNSSLFQFQCLPCQMNCLRCSSILRYNEKSSISVCHFCQKNFMLLQNHSCFYCGQTAETVGCSKCNSNGICQVCFEGYSLQQNKCVNISQVIIDTTEGLMISCIILGCITLVLLIVVIYVKTFRKRD